MMRMTPILAAMAIISPAVGNASDVRRSDLPTAVQGTWAPSADACGETSEKKIVIATNKHSSANLTCAIEWVTVTAAASGSNYSTYSRCVDRSTNKANPPSNLLIRPIDSNHISIGSNEGDFKPYQRCQ
jgi:hypothetical protein